MKKNRNLYTKEDVQKISQYIKEKNLNKIYVVGGIGSGKSSFSEDISQILDYKNIDLDSYCQLFIKEKEREPITQKEIMDFALEKNQTPFVINHSDILRQGLLKDAELVVFLNPSKEELIESRKIRESSGVEGDWKNIGIERYDSIIKENKVAFEKLKGNIVYENLKSGTIAKSII